VKKALIGVLLALSVVACGGSHFALAPLTMPDATVGQPYEVAFSGTWPEGGDVGSVTASIESGSLPPGIEHQPSTANATSRLVGIPTTAGTYTFKVYAKAGQCTMAGCPNDTREYTIVVNP
jgi:hypothetical protein